MTQSIREGPSGVFAILWPQTKTIMCSVVSGAPTTTDGDGAKQGQTARRGYRKYDESYEKLRIASCKVAARRYLITYENHASRW